MILMLVMKGIYVFMYLCRMYMFTTRTVVVQSLIVLKIQYFIILAICVVNCYFKTCHQ